LLLYLLTCACDTEDVIVIILGRGVIVKEGGGCTFTT